MLQPKYYRQSWVSWGNRFWTGPHLTGVQNTPLSVILCGHTSWNNSHSLERENCQVFSLELVVGGDAWFLQDSKSHLVVPGQVFLVHKGKKNRFSPGPSGYLHKRMVILEGVMLDLTLQSLGLLNTHVVTCRDFTGITRLFKQANRLAAEGKSGHPVDAAWALSSLAYDILLSVARSKTEATIPPEIRKALDYMMHNLNQPLSLEQISRASGLSMFHFSRMFKNVLNHPPLTYFQQQKMRLAENLLQNTQMLVKEISALLGFEDPLYFSAQFKKFSGKSPREFRKGKESFKRSKE